MIQSDLCSLDVELVLVLRQFYGPEEVDEGQIARPVVAVSENFHVGCQVKPVDLENKFYFSQKPKTIFQGFFF